MKLLIRYLGERLTLPVLAVAALVSAASFLIAPTANGWDALARCLLAAALVVQFRLWDDLEDRERDRAIHPRRVLVEATTRSPFRVAVGMLGVGIIAGLAWHAGGWAVAIYVLLGLSLKLWYHWWPPVCREGVIHACVLLLKYPVFVALIAPRMTIAQQPGRSVLVMLAVYVVVGGYELWHVQRAAASHCERQV